jgi:hypothetical protein
MALHPIRPPESLTLSQVSALIDLPEAAIERLEARGLFPRHERNVSGEKVWREDDILPLAVSAEEP